MEHSTPPAEPVRNGFACVPHWVTEDPSLSDASYRTYACIHAQTAQQTGTGWITQQSIADRTGRSLSTVKRSLKDLRDRGLVEQVSRGGRRGDRALASTYRVVTQQVVDEPLAPTQEVPNRSPVTLPNRSPVTPQQEPLNKNPELQEPSLSLITHVIAQPPTKEIEMRKPTSRPTPMTDEWEPDPSLVTREMEADMKTLGMSLARELLQFRDWQIEKERQQRDWDRVFRQWLNRHIDEGMQKRVERGTALSSTIDDNGIPSWLHQHMDSTGETREERRARIHAQQERMRLVVNRHAS